MDPTENIMEISILMNISICLIGIAIMVLNKGINTKVTIYTLILTIIALITFVITLLFNRKNMFIVVLITLVLSLAQFIIGILQIIATDNMEDVDPIDNKNSEMSKFHHSVPVLSYIFASLCVCVGLTIFIAQILNLSKKKV